MNIITVVNVWAWTPSRSSSFLIGRNGHNNRNGIMGRTYRTTVSSLNSSPKWTMYQEDITPSSSSSSDPINAWTVLSTTERWISRTLAQASTSTTAMSSSSSSSSNPGNNNNNNNPYVRKEISYYCEHPTTATSTTTTSTTSDMNPETTTSSTSSSTTTQSSSSSSYSSLFLLAASIFRHLKEMRQIGEQHVQYEIEQWTNEHPEDDLTTNIDRMIRTTLRQTHVIVIPSHTPLTESFVYFDNLIQTINQMRRNARDFYVHRHSTTVFDPSSSSSTLPYEDYYSISINCAHLHPMFGQTNTNNNNNDEQDEDEDPKYIEYQKQRLLARQSPYPTIVMEVRVTPTPLDLLIPPPLLPPTTPTTMDPKPWEKGTPKSDATNAVSLTDIQKLEALFGQSAYIKEEDDDDTDDLATTMEHDENYLWDHVMGKTIHELVIPKPPPTPIQLAQEYISSITSTTTKNSNSNSNIATIPPHVSFTTTNTSHVDEAYEYVMTNIAMCFEEEYDMDRYPASSSIYYYLVFPNFLPLAATSFEKFTREIQRLYSVIVGPSTLTTTMTFTTYHPEHIQSTHRSPLPILAIEHHRTSSNQDTDGISSSGGD